MRTKAEKKAEAVFMLIVFVLVLFGFFALISTSPFCAKADTILQCTIEALSILFL